MGIPYSKEINSAFDQVTPLVGAGFEVLKTTKNIAILLAVLQVFIGILLSLILLALIGLLYITSPDLEKERLELVTPFLQWLSSWIFTYGTIALWAFKVYIVIMTAALGLFLWHGSQSGYTFPASAPNNVNNDVEEEE